MTPINGDGLFKKGKLFLSKTCTLNKIWLVTYRLLRFGDFIFHLFGLIGGVVVITITEELHVSSRAANYF